MKNKEKYNLTDLDFFISKYYDYTTMSTSIILSIDLKGVRLNNLAKIHICNYPGTAFYEHVGMTEALEKFAEWLEEECE